MITRIVLTLLLAGGLTACGGDSDEPGATHVVAGFYPLAFAAEEIRGVDVEVTNLTPAGAEPHDLELTPREVEEILGADLVLYVGEGFQPAVEEAVESGDVPALDVLETAIPMSGSIRLCSPRSSTGSPSSWATGRAVGCSLRA